MDQALRTCLLVTLTWTAVASEIGKGAIDPDSHNIFQQEFSAYPGDLRSKNIRYNTAQKIEPLLEWATSTNGDASGCSSFPCMIFEDNFDTLNYKKWDHELTAGGGGNWEFQYYANNRSNSYVKDGILYLKPTLTTDRFGDNFLQSGDLDIWGGAPASLCTGPNFYGCKRNGNANNYINPIQSARLRTVKAFNFRYGKVEVEAMTPKGDWIWPAIWMLPKMEEYGQWPASGEIDIMESRGNEDLRNGKGESTGRNRYGATLHWGPYNGMNKYDRTNAARIGDFAERFHKFGLEWTPTRIKLLLDNEVVLDVQPEKGFWEYGDLDKDLGHLGADANPWRNGDKMAPFDKEFYLVMNVAVGGTNGFFGDDWVNKNGPKPWTNTSPTAPKDFWLQKNSWYPTWNPDINNGEDAAMKINYVRVWKLENN